MSNADLVIEAVKLSKQFEEAEAVREVTFSLKKGQIFGFIGPSGSGKTTTIRLLTGYHMPTSGKVRVLGDTPEHFDRSVRRRFGYMPQLFALYPGLTVWQNLNFNASLYGIVFRRRRLNRLLEFVELKDHKHKKAAKLSGGMLRRLSLAAAMVHEPELLFLDEPTGGLDPVLRKKFWDYFRELQSAGTTLLITTQYVSEASYCDLVGVMAEGRLIMVETPDGLLKKAYGGEIVDLHLEGGRDLDLMRSIGSLPYVKAVSEAEDGNLRIVVDDASTAIPALIESCSQRGTAVRSIEQYVPPFDDVFYQLMKKYPREGSDT